MEFLKKNYEKVILSLVLLGLAVAAAVLPFWVSSEKRRLKEIEDMDVREQKRELKPFDLSTNETVLRRLRRPDRLRLTREHNLFNPATWQRRSDGSLIKIVTGDEVGPGALKIADIRPLRLVVTYEGTSLLSNETLHRFKITREADRNPRNRTPVVRPVAAVGTKTDLFILKEMRPREDPKEFVLEMLDDKRQITVTKDKPYEGAAGYIADLKYDPEKQVFLNRRLDDRLVFAGDTNKIVAITATAVTVEALSNKKRTTIETKASPGAPAP